MNVVLSQGGWNLPIHADIIAKCILSFAALVGVCRFAGRKYDVVVPMSFAVIAAVVSLDRRIPLLDGLLALVTWGLLSALLGLVLTHFAVADTAIKGKPTPIVENGNILEGNLHKSRLTVTDMMTQLRSHGAFKLADVELALLEPDGQMSVMKKSSVEPITPKTAGITVPNESGPTIVVQDGKVKVDALHQAGHSVGWLRQQLTRQGADDYDDVFLAQLDSQDNVYVDLKDDVAKREPEDPSVKSKLTLLAALKKIQADLEHFTMETENANAKARYETMAIRLSQIIKNVREELRDKRPVN